jgi:hypothetical protein
MKGKKHPRPAWWKSSYFWITGALLFISIYGFAAGPSRIADPGQSDSKPQSLKDPRDLDGTTTLPLLYLGAAVLMGFNGIISHRQYVAMYKAEQEAQSG